MCVSVRVCVHACSSQRILRPWSAEGDSQRPRGSPGSPSPGKQVYSFPSCTGSGHRAAQLYEIAHWTWLLWPGLATHSHGALGSHFSEQLCPACQVEMLGSYATWKEPRQGVMSTWSGVCQSLLVVRDFSLRAGKSFLCLTPTSGNVSHTQVPLGHREHCPPLTYSSPCQSPCWTGGWALGTDSGLQKVQEPQTPSLQENRVLAQSLEDLRMLSLFL